ncbi:TPA: phage tail protein [Mannheimia haemolytica]
MGGSSGGSSHTPVEAPESGRSSQRVKIVEVISEGSIGGLVNGLKSVYLDNTPVQNEDGTYNFTNVEAEGRTGTQDQDVMSDFDTTEKEVSVGTEVKKTTPLTRTVIDSNVTRLRLTLGVQSLFKQEDNGDTNGTSVDFKITVGNATYNLNINGKYSSQYLRTIYIENLPQVPFTVRVERLNADSDSQRLQNKTVWASYTEITDTDFAYPNTAYVGIKFNSENFSSIPTRGYEIFGIEVKLPSNYDPETRKYTGLWDGTFKIAWTDNPAWVLMDILLNKRYGLGERLGDFGVDKWALYSIAQYCDQLVPDGYGNMEPRFTCNVWMTEQRSAYDVISDLCSIFRGIPVWNGTEMTFIIDRPADPVWTYTNANVINGEFSRQYSAKKARHNAIQVEYKDKDNAYQSAIEYVSDNDLIRKNGFNLLKVTAFGCTSRGQAYRTGRWILESEKLETETVTFSVGSEGLMHIPGDIIRVTDNHFAGTNLGGRVLSVSGKVVTVDREITLPANSYFSYINAEAKHASIKITKIENGTKLTLETAPAGLKEYDVYSISSQKVTSRLYRCMTITEEDGTYTITALQHEPQKEAIVDNGASFEPVATSLLSGGLQKVSNADVSLSENGVEITFDYAANTTTAVKYQVKLYRNGELYRQLVDVSDTKLTFSNLPDGSYTVEIRAKNERGQLSDPITRTFEINLRIPRFITKSLLFAIELDWDLPKTATVGNYTELWRSPENDVSKAVKVATLPYPQNSYILNGINLNESYYFFVRCGDKAGNKGQFTEGVFGEADHNPDTLLNVLEGQITRSQLGSDLIASLQQDIDTAVAGEAGLRQSAVANAVSQIMAESQARAKAIQDEVKARTVALTTEANNRTKAIQAESANLTKKIQAETTARGTAVTQLQNVDAQQAQLISAVTAKANNALSGLEKEKIARANGDKAEAQARTALQSEWRNDVDTAKRGAISAAAVDAQTKADTAKREAITAAERTAQAKADAAKAQAIASASNDATSKANAAKAQAIADAAAKDEAVKRQAAQDAQAKADNAKSQAIAEAQKLNQATSAKITNLEQTVTQQNQASATRYQELSAKLDNLSVGGRNLLKNTANVAWYQWRQQDRIVSNRLNVNGGPTNLGMRTPYQQGLNLVDGEQLVLSFEYRTDLPNLNYTYILSNDDGNMGGFEPITTITDGEWHKATAKVRVVKNRRNIAVLIGSYKPSSGSYLEINKLKLERGTVATDWTPAPEDADSAISAVSADLTSYKQTQATKEQATAQQINGLTTRLANAESGISQVEKVVSDNQSSTATQLNQLSVNLTKAQTDLNAKITQEQSARADADKANADRITSVTSRVANAESSISNIQSTKASKTEVASLAQQSLQAVWQADAQAKVDALKVGGRNLIKNSNVRYESNRYSTRYELSTAPQVGDDFVVTLWGNLGETRSGIGVYNSQGFSELTKLVKIRDGVYQGKAAWRKPMRGSLEVTPNDTHLNVYFYPNGDTSTNIIERIKLELGTVATDWTPAPEDADGAINAISSKVDSVQQTLTTANQALGSRIDTVTASVNDAKSQVSQVSKVVSDVSGKLSATSTLKTQVIAGGRKAIAGIALGAESDGVTTESSVIVMADKFGIVANANDGNVKPVFSVVNGQVGIRGDLVVAGSVTRDKFASGGGGNLLQNPIFANLDDGLPYGCAVWTNGMTNVRKSSSNTVGTWSLQSYLPNENLLVVSANGTNGQYLTVSMPSTSIVSEQWYMLSAYMGAHRAQCALMARCHLSTGGYKDFITSYSTPSFNGGIGKSAERKFIKFQAPANTVTVQPIFWLKGVSSENNKILMAARPMLEECTAHTSEPSPWVNSGPAEVHGGSIIANTIRGEHIQANQRITAPIIEGGSLNINNRFKVSNSGQVEMRSNSGNVGMVMNNDAIIVYDEWGNPRVKIGKLS